MFKENYLIYRKGVESGGGEKKTAETTSTRYETVRESGRSRRETADDVADDLTTNESSDIRAKVDQIIEACAAYGFKKEDITKKHLVLIENAVSKGFVDVSAIRIVNPDSLSVTLKNRSGNILTFPLQKKLIVASDVIVPSSENDALSFEELVLEQQQQYDKKYEQRRQRAEQKEEEAKSDVGRALQPWISRFKSIKNPGGRDKEEFATTICKAVLELPGGEYSGGIDYAEAALRAIDDVLREKMGWESRELDGFFQAFFGPAMIRELDLVAEEVDDEAELAKVREWQKEIREELNG